MSSLAPELFLHSAGELNTKDGLRLYLQWFLPKTPRGAVLIAHGLFEHSGRHAALAEHLASRGFACYAFDFRGHGRSPGKRAHVGRFVEYHLDLRAGSELLLERHPRLPPFLFAHSFGGLVALDCLLAPDPPSFTGVALSSPLLGVHPSSAPSLPLALLARLLSHVWPSLPFPNGIDPRQICRDPTVVEGYLKDPLVSRMLTPRAFTEIQEATRRVVARAPLVRVPLLVLYGGADRIVDPEATRRFAESVPGSRPLRFPDLFHEILREKERDTVLSPLDSFLDSLLAREPSPG